MDLKFEKKIWRKRYEIVVGIDEAGRGPLAGPVFAGAVCIIQKSKILPAGMAGQGENQNKDLGFKGLLRKVKDSKQLSSKQREKIYEELTKSPFIVWAEGRAGPSVIDRINILQATKLAMKRAAQGLIKKLVEDGPLPTLFLVIDGNFPLNLDIPQKSIIRGDQKVFSIAVASIIAKVRRDRLMIKYAKRFPQYGFEKHKGYPTRLHKNMAAKHGLCEIHRKSFNLGLPKSKLLC